MSGGELWACVCVVALMRASVYPAHPWLPQEAPLPAAAPRGRAEGAREDGVRKEARAIAEDAAGQNPGRQFCTAWEVDGRTGQECFTASTPDIVVASVAATPPPIIRTSV